MSQTCEYCDDDHDVSDTVFTIVSYGFGHANKDHKPFCSVECRTWWRRRCSDNRGAWEQPMQPGYQGRLDRFVSDDTSDPNANESATQLNRIAASENATVEAET
jgi:hypothetical protein